MISVTVEKEKELERIVATPAIEYFDKLEDDGSDIKVIAYYSDGSSDDVTDDCDFDSNNEDVADVDDNQICSGEEEGKTKITVEYEDEEDEITVEVDKDKVFRKLDKIVASPSKDDLEDIDDEGKDVKVIAYYDDGSDDEVTEDCIFESDEEEIAYVNEDFTICSGEEDGDTTITVKYYEDGEEEFLPGELEQGKFKGRHRTEQQHAEAFQDRVGQGDQVRVQELALHQHFLDILNPRAERGRI
jgi:hypothetical protein